LSTVSGTNSASRTASAGTTTHSVSATSSGAPAEQTSNAAVVNVAGIGAAAVGFAAYLL
jgi:hypothetical protein